PEDCTVLGCNERMNVAAGWQLKLGPCLGNMCLEERAYTVVATADKPWLCSDDGAGGVVTVGSQYQFSTPPVLPGRPDCFNDEGPLQLCVPPDAGTGETVTVLVEVYAADDPGLPPVSCRTVYQVTANSISAADDVPQPALLAVQEVRPNPFNPATEFAFTLPGLPGQSHHATLRVYDLRGELVRTLVDERLEAGLHRRTWDGRDGTGRTVAAGVYLYRLQADGRTANGKVVLLK
ncbi:MAG: FlgD immunoglobulin-like domain containing protein, partial [Candidatus Krumholzibacteriia bacterium]